MGTNREQMIALLKKAQEMQARWATEYCNVQCEVDIRSDEGRLWFTLTASDETLGFGKKREDGFVNAGIYDHRTAEDNMAALNKFVAEVESFAVKVAA